MKNILSYSFISNSFVLLFLLGQLWSSSINFCLWVMDAEQDFIELSTCEDSESEEENEKKEKEDKNRTITFEFNSIKTLLSLKRFSSKNSISIHQPDISTPPPRIFSDII